MKRGVFLTLTCFLLSWGCGKDSREPAPPPPERIKVVRVRQEELRKTLETFGNLAFRTKADVYPSVEGRVEKLFAEEGDRVEKGGILAMLSKEKLLLSRAQAASTVESKRALLALGQEKLAEGRKSVEARFLGVEKAEAELERRRTEFVSDSRTFENKKRLFSVGGIAEGELEAVRNRYLRSKTDLEQAQRDVEMQRIGFRDRDILHAGHGVPRNEEERRRLLVEINTGTLRAERDVAAAELDAAEAELRRIEILLGETEIRSPLTGTVAGRGIEAGEKATPETLLFSIFDTAEVYARGEVGERNLPEVRIGQDAEVRVEGFPPLRGRVRLISPYLNPETKSGGIKILLDNPGSRLLPGMFARINIFVGEPYTTLTVPESALTREEDGVAVFAVRNGILFKIPVTPGERKNGRVAVEGISKGEAVAEKPSRSWREGIRAEAVE